MKTKDEPYFSYYVLLVFCVMLQCHFALVLTHEIIKTSVDQSKAVSIRGNGLRLHRSLFKMIKKYSDDSTSAQQINAYNKNVPLMQDIKISHSHTDSSRRDEKLVPQTARGTVFKKGIGIPIEDSNIQKKIKMEQNVHESEAPVQNLRESAARVVSQQHQETNNKSVTPFFSADHIQPVGASDKAAELISNLEQDILNIWSYKEYIKAPDDLMLDQGLINRAKISISSARRLRNLFQRALSGDNIHAALISSSVSRAFLKDPASKQWLYHNALLHWWNKVVTPITNSQMVLQDVSISGVGSDYFSRCLKRHLPDNGKTNLILWELSESDYKPRGVLRPVDAQSLEQFMRSTLEYRSNPEVILVNFFRNNNFNQTAYCKELDEETEARIANHYDCTALSWPKAICPYLEDDIEDFSYSYVFSRDKVHPSIIGHAQMAYILIDHLRDEFLKYLQQPKPSARSEILPKALFTQIYKTFCYTSLKAVDEPINTDSSDLPIIIIPPDNFDKTDHRSWIAKKTSIRPTVIRFVIPGSPQEISYRTISVLPYFSQPLRTVARVDDKPFVPLRLNNLDSGRIVPIKPSLPLSSGNHMLRVWSLDKHFRILALVVDGTEHA